MSGRRPDPLLRESPPGPRTRFPAPAALFGAPAILPPRHGSSGDSAFLSIVLEEFDRNAFEIALLPHVALACKRALACTCYALRERLTPHLRAATLSVLRDDAVWSNALFVARLPGLSDLRVEGETSLPSMDLARYRRLDALKVGSLGPPAALFFGAAIAASNARLRLSDGNAIRNIAALRSSPSPDKAEPNASDADRAALLGALASNQHEIFSALDALSYASGALGHDREVVRAAVREDGTALEYASSELRADKSIVMDAVRTGATGAWPGAWLGLASEALRGDSEVVLAAGTRYVARALSYATDAVKEDRAVVLVAVRMDGMALRYAAGSIKGDREVVLEAVRQSGQALQYATGSLRADRAVAFEAVRQDGDALRWAGAVIKADKDVALAAVRKEGRTLEFVAEALQADREVVLAAVDQAQARAQATFRSTLALIARAGATGTVLSASATLRAHLRQVLLYARDRLFEDDAFVLAAHEHAKAIWTTPANDLQDMRERLRLLKELV